MALLGDRAVCVDQLWRTVLESAGCGDRASMVLVHPGWWPQSRLARVVAAARTVAAAVSTESRATLLARPGRGSQPIVVEIAPRLVLVNTVARAIPRVGDPGEVAELVAQRVGDTAPDRAPVLVDGPRTVAGAGELAAMVTERLGRHRPDLAVRQADDAWLLAGAAAILRADSDQAVPVGPVVTATDRGGRHARRLCGAGVAVAVAAMLLAPGRHRDGPSAAPPATFLVEGRIAVQVPAHWPVQRITAGPGSVRVQVSSPEDPQAAIHLTQVGIPDVTFDVTVAELEHALAQANATEGGDVFVDFNPSDSSAGRRTLTYREIRADHHVRWVVFVDGSIRIGIGCQSRPDGADGVRAVCEQAVRTAHAVQ